MPGHKSEQLLRFGRGELTVDVMTGDVEKLEIARQALDLESEPKGLADIIRMCDERGGSR